MKEDTKTTILLIEDSKTFAKTIKKNLENEFYLSVDWASTYSEATRLIAERPERYFISLVDLHLPDASEGEILDFVLAQNIPPIVLTGRFGDEMREYIWSKKVIDYILKESPQSVDYVTTLVRRIYRNREIKVLVVEDSTYSRKHLCQLLRVHKYQVLEASHAWQALEILEDHQDVRLAIVDYYMPQMDGIELTRRIRRKWPKEQLAIIGISAQGSNIMSARFIKNGANDFLTKPYINEELYCRITQNMEMFETLERLQDASNKDFLTDLYNRRYLFESGQLLHANSLRKHMSVSIAMLDVDHFKQVNDQYGHKAGDRVLQYLAGVLKKRFRRSDILARFGGEEFCIVASNMACEHAQSIFDELRESIAATDIIIDGTPIRISVSIGVCSCVKATLEEMINEADRLLYKAKKLGRNRVVCS